MQNPMEDQRTEDLPSKSWEKQLLRTLVLVNIAGILEKADEALLPGVYREIGISLHASPTSLGSLTLLRSIVQILCFPLAAYLSVHHNRASVIALGAMLWAIATFFVGASSTFVEVISHGNIYSRGSFIFLQQKLRCWSNSNVKTTNEVAISRALNGIGLALVIPAIQSLVADAASPHKRGLAFGWLHFTASLGGLFGNVFSVLLAGTTIFGLAGWRASFHIIAAVSVVVAFLVHQFAVDPRLREGAKGENNWGSAILSSAAFKQTLIEAKTVVRIPTFIAIVAQGVAGTFPGAALSFAPMWLELIGFSHNITAAIIGTFSFSTCVGGLFGGWLGDIFARHFPNSGRVILAQFSSGIGIPLGALLLLGLPNDSSTAFSHATVFFIMGFLKSWCATATNNPIFAEIVPEKMRTSIYALDRSFESFLASFAPPLVGLLAEHAFGYVSSPPSENTDTSAADKQNAAALARALYLAIGVPYTCCCLLYSILYFTYPKDRDRVAELQTNEEVMPGISDYYNLKPGYVRLGKDSEQHIGVELRNLEDKRASKSSTAEKVHILSDVS